jgi:hypothetical protein
MVGEEITVTFEICPWQSPKLPFHSDYVCFIATRRKGKEKGTKRVILTDPVRWRRDEELMLCNRARLNLSTCHTARARASTVDKEEDKRQIKMWLHHESALSPLLIFRRRRREASRDMRQADQQQRVIRLNSLLHFVNFSLTELLLLQIHFLQIDEREGKRGRIDCK